MCRGRRHRPYRCSPLSFDLDEYRRRAERFSEELSREYYLHLAGQRARARDRADLRWLRGPVRERGRGAVEGARPAPPAATTRSAGFATCSSSRSTGCWAWRPVPESAELAGLEASLEIDPGDGPVPYRAVPIEQANEPEADRRAALEEARNAVLAERLNPLYRAALERAHELCRALGWPSYAAAYAELRGDRPRGAGAARQPPSSRPPRMPTRRSSIPSSGAPECPRWGSFAVRTCRASFAPRTSTPCSRPTGWSTRLADTLAGLGIDLGARPTSTSTPNRAGPSHRAPSARRRACPTRSIW